MCLFSFIMDDIYVYFLYSFYPYDLLLKLKGYWFLNINALSLMNVDYII